MLTIAEAAKLAKVSRSTLLKAIKAGKLSAVRGIVRGQFRVDAAELHRVYPQSSAEEHAPETPQEGSEVLVERVRALERMVSTLADERDDLRRRLDSETDERRRLTYLLTHQPEKSLDTRQEPSRPWLHWKKAVLAIVLGIAAALAWNTVTKEKPPPQKPPVLESKPQAPNQNLERWKPDDNGG